MVEEVIKLTEEQLLELIRGKRLTFINGDYFRIDIIPPRYGITITYEDWKKILREFIPTSQTSYDLIHEIEKKF